MTDIVTPDGEILGQARSIAQSWLSTSSAFANLPWDEQQQVYFDTVRREADNLLQQQGRPPEFSLAKATDSGKEMGFKGYDPGFQGSTQAFNELVDSVDFPQFVADLLKAVFNANLKVMKEQTDSYIKLMKECTKSTADFIKKINDDDTFAKLAES